jgi:molybdopterin converting factor small subunit
MGQLRYLTGKDCEEIECFDRASLAKIITVASKAYDKRFLDIILDENGAIQPSLIVIVNDEPAGENLTQGLSDGDAVTILTAIAGG